MNYSKQLMTISTAALFLLFAQLARAQGYPLGTVVIPQSNIEKPDNVGVRVHTNVNLVVPLVGLTAAQPGQAQ